MWVMENDCSVRQSRGIPINVAELPDAVDGDRKAENQATNSIG